MKCGYVGTLVGVVVMAIGSGCSDQPAGQANSGASAGQEHIPPGISPEVDKPEWFNAQIKVSIKDEKSDLRFLIFTRVAPALRDFMKDRTAFTLTQLRDIRILKPGETGEKNFRLGDFLDVEVYFERRLPPEDNAGESVHP